MRCRLVTMISARPYLAMRRRQGEERTVVDRHQRRPVQGLSPSCTHSLAGSNGTGAAEQMQRSALSMRRSSEACSWIARRNTLAAQTILLRGWTMSTKERHLGRVAVAGGQFAA